MRAELALGRPCSTDSPQVAYRRLIWSRFAKSRVAILRALLVMAHLIKTGDGFEGVAALAAYLPLLH